MATGPKSACENCGANAWTHGTAGERKGALTAVTMVPGLQFNPGAGTPVDVYACENCGNLRLFAIEKQN